MNEYQKILLKAVKESKFYMDYEWNKENEEKFINWWEKRKNLFSKPCLKIQYCPYGELIELFPLLGPNRENAVKHNEFLKEQLEKGAYSGHKFEELFKIQVKNFNPNNYPEIISEELLAKECKFFGHLCAVYFVSENVTESVDILKNRDSQGK